MGALSILFAAVYGGCNWLASQRQETLKLYLDWELAIPLVPWMIWIYASLFALFFLPVFCLNQRELARLSRRIAAAIMISGAVFLLFPAQLGFARAADTGVLFGIIHALDHPHNLAPSLHVSLSGLILGSLLSPSPRWLRVAIAAWFTLICVSVVLVHQHHLLDVLTGILVICVLMRTWRKGRFQ
jgi:membrane-associated phospholipid phosphatase